MGFRQVTMQLTLTKAVLVGCVCVSMWPTVCVCFSHGANSASCVDMKPGHISAQPQHIHTQAPVTVHASRTVYLPEQTLMVSVRSSRGFMGLLLQARSVPEDQVVGGEFTLTPPGTHTLSCISSADTVTHSDKLLKRNLSFTWRAPAQPSGDMRFYITVVHSYFVHWSRIRSALVHDGTRRIAGFDVGLQSRIISVSLMKSPKMSTTKPPSDTLSLQHKLAMQPTTTHLHDSDSLSGVTQETHKLSNTTSQACTLTNQTIHSTPHTEMNSTVHSHTATHTSAPQTYTGAETLPHTPIHTLVEHFHTRLHPHTVSDTLMDNRPQAHINTHTLKPHVQGNRYGTTSSTYSRDITSHASKSTPATTYTPKNTNTRPPTLTSLLIRHRSLNIHTPTDPVDASQLVFTETVVSSTTSLFITSTSTPIPGSTPSPMPFPNSNLTPTLSLTSIPKSLTFSYSSPVPNSTSAQATKTTSIQNPLVNPIPVLPSITGPTSASTQNQTSAAMSQNSTSNPTQTSTSTVKPTYTSVSTPMQASTTASNPRSKPPSITIPTSYPTQTGNPISLNTSIPALNRSPTSVSNSDYIPIPNQPSMTIQTPKSKLVTHTLIPVTMHTSNPPSPAHIEPSPALQYSVVDPLPPRQSRDDSYSHVLGEGAKPKPSQKPRQPLSTPKGVKPDLVPRQHASELGLLLVGVSAGLGMAVAVGLRYLQKKHCRRHTAMSLSDQSHGNRSVIHVQECGDLVQVRRIRENSFLLLQAEYNLITAPGS